MHVAIGVWVDPGSTVAVELAGHHPQQRSPVVRGEQGDLVARQVLVGGRDHLVLRRQVHPELHAVEAPAADDELLGRCLDVQDARAGGHPLRAAVEDPAATAVGVLVLDDPVDHVGDGLEAAVRMPGGAERLTRAVVDRSHLIHVDERIETRRVHAGEGAPDREPLALEARGRRGDRHHVAGVAVGIRASDPGQAQGVGGHCGHGPPFDHDTPSALRWSAGSSPQLAPRVGVPDGRRSAWTGGSQRWDGTDRGGGGGVLVRRGPRRRPTSIARRTASGPISPTSAPSATTTA